VCVSGPLAGFALQSQRLPASAIALGGGADASAAAGEVGAALLALGGGKPMTARGLRRHSGSGLSGRPPSEPFRCLKRATRCIISSRLQFRISFQSLMAFPPGAIIVPR